MEEIQAVGLQRRRLPRADVHHGHHAAARQRRRRRKRYLPKIAGGELRLQAFGVTEPTSGTDTLSLRTTARREGNDHYVINGQKIWTSRAEHSDLMLLLARTTPREQVKKRTDGLSVFLVDMRESKGKSLTITPIRTHDEPRHHGGVLRRSARAGGELDRRGGPGLPLHPLRHERRAHPDRGGMHRRLPNGSSTRRPPTPRSARCSAARSARTRACSFRSRALTRRCAPPN